MFDRFTERARKVMSLARQAAQHYRHDYIGTEHILLGLIEVGSGVAAQVLEKHGVDRRAVRSAAERIIKSGTCMVTMGQLPFTPRAKRVLELSLEEAQNLRHNYIGTEHLLLGLIREDEGIAAQVLKQLGLELEKVRSEVRSLLGDAEAADSPQPQASMEQTAATLGTSPATSALGAFGRDLTERARTGALGEIAGREAEIGRVAAVLAGAVKPSALLVGPAGSGRKSIIDGLALRIARDEVPEALRGRRIVTIDIPLLLAGAKHRGQMEERVAALVSEVRRSGDVILFFEEFQLLAGTGSMADGSPDLAAALRQGVASGDVRCIGVTTRKGLARCRRRAAEFLRLFRIVRVEPPSAEETLSILECRRAAIEGGLLAKFGEGALRAAAELAGHFVRDRCLPDSAIDVALESALDARLASQPEPPSTRDLRSRLAPLVEAKTEAVRVQAFEDAAKAYAAIQEIERQIETSLAAWRAQIAATARTVTVADVERAVSRMTGVPEEAVRRREA